MGYIQKGYTFWYCSIQVKRILPSTQNGYKKGSYLAPFSRGQPRYRRDRGSGRRTSSECSWSPPLAGARPRSHGATSSAQDQRQYF